MMIKPFLDLTHMCPACGNYFYENDIMSFNTFGAICYSDGRMDNCYTPKWLTQCPKCLQYFAKEYLFKLPVPVSVESGLADRGNKRRYIVEHKNEYGHLDSFCGGGKGFYEKALEQGLYFPIMVKDNEKIYYKRLLYRELWHEYNRCRNQMDEAVYLKHCRELIEMIKDIKVDAYKLSLAELYRNVGDFEKCLAVLDGIKTVKKIEKTVKCIREEAIKGNKFTVMVEEY